MMVTMITICIGICVYIHIIFRIQPWTRTRSQMCHSYVWSSTWRSTLSARIICSEEVLVTFIEKTCLLTIAMLVFNYFLETSITLSWIVPRSTVSLFVLQSITSAPSNDYFCNDAINHYTTHHKLGKKKELLMRTQPTSLLLKASRI